MRRSTKVVLGCVAGLALIALVLLAPVFPWATRFQHTLSRVTTKTRIAYYRWRDHPPRLISLTGRVDQPGAEIFVLDSTSGWAAISGPDGRFTLPLVTWYPGASFDFVVCDDAARHSEKGLLYTFTSTDLDPGTGPLQVGDLQTARGKPVDLAALLGLNGVTREAYDEKNRAFYQELAARLTAGKDSEAEKVAAIRDYVASKLNYNETQFELGSPRRVLETGSEFCGHLSAAMATLLETIHIRNRMIDMIDDQIPYHSHTVVEVWQDGAWQLHDPTYGISFKSPSGSIANYQQVSTNPGLITDDVFASLSRKARADVMSWMPGVYRSGFHHYFVYKGEDGLGAANQLRRLPEHDDFLTYCSVSIPKADFINRGSTVG